MASYEWPPSGSGGGGSGSVTSVALSLPSIFNVTGSPVTTFGTLTGTLAIEPVNTVFAGPASGASAPPTFRALVAADLPNLSGLYVPQSEVGAANGVASLDGTGKVPLSQLTAAVFVYQGAWNPALNSPMLMDGTGTTGYTYWVSAYYAGPVAGLSDPSMYNFNVGDLVIYNGTTWELTTPAAGVQTVNGANGAVTVNAINQLTGDVTTTAAAGSQSKVASLVATSNSTLTMLSALTSATALASIGTVTTGVWNATTVGIPYGGTGQTSAGAAFTALSPLASTGDIIYEASPGVAAALPIGTSGYVLTVVGGIPGWAASPGGVSSVNGQTGAVTVNAINQLTGDVTAPAASGSVSEASTVAKIQGTVVSGTTGSGNVVFSASPTLTGTALGANLTLTGTLTTPTIVSTSGGVALSITGGAASSPGNGGNVTVAGASGSGTTTGGNGGTLNLNGGSANGTGNNSGGAVNIQAGNSVNNNTGGTVTVSSGNGGTGSGTAGQTGGTTNINGGTGGAGSSTSGNGGGATVKAGSGGGGVAGGQGGTAQLVGGTGGTGSSTGGNGGAANVQGGSPGSVAGSQGGSVSITSGNGTSTGAGGAGGSVTIQTGQANGNNTVNYSGGSLTMSVGASYGSSGGSNITMTAGQGGVGTGTAGANGGNTNINAGNGGAGSSTGGTGGNVVISGGTGGNSTTPGAGGYIIFEPAATTSTAERFRITSAAVYASNAQIEAATAGYGFSIKSGSNCKMGTATLAAGTVTVSNTSVTSNSLIYLTVQSAGGTVGSPYISAKSTGTSFTITSTSGSDTSTVAWMIMEEM